MQIAKELAGFSRRQGRRPAQGDRQEGPRGDGALKPEFVAGCQATASRRRHRLLWATNEKSADYSFNKSHAACYGLISYRTAWLKANYPAEYMAALISSVMDTKDKVPFFVAKTEGMGIEILPPDVNISDHEFVVDDGDIRFGLDAVKGVGYAAVEAIKARARGRRAVRLDLGLLRARRPPRGEQALDRGAHQVRRVRHDRRSRKGMLACSSRPSPPARRPARRADRPGLDLRPRRRGGRRRRRGGLRAPRTRRSRARSSSRPSCWPSRRRPSGSSSPRIRSRRCARRCGPRSTRRCPSWPSAGTATGSRPAASSRRPRRSAPRRATTMMFATLDDLEGSIECMIFAKALQSTSGVARRRRDRGHARPRRQGRQGHLDRRQTVEPFRAHRRRRSRPRARPPRSCRRARSRCAPLDAARLPGVDHRRAQARARQSRRGVRRRPRRPHLGGPAAAAPGLRVPRQGDAEPARRAGVDPAGRPRSSRLTDSARLGTALRFVRRNGAPCLTSLRRMVCN